MPIFLFVMETALSLSWLLALVGFHVVAPSDMMDNRVFAIKTALNKEELGNKVTPPT